MGFKSTNVTSVTVAVETRKNEALRLRMTGMQYREIADAMISYFGRENLPATYDERYAWRDVQSEMNKLRAISLDTANDLRMLEARRLDQMQLTLMPEVLKGNIRAMNMALKIMDHRAKLFGMYAPAQLKVHDWRSEILELVKTGKITMQQVEEEIGVELAQQLLESGSTGTVEGSFTEEKDQ